ncbi:Ada metal-binding domain-containing protein [Taibaiella helva]|uniref:Ada metal-binding domain-containing protein n=1 Tax=Taibaiella helva TaxID=2301235 RepID=UPI000E56950C|nr:Ada metal-binding domain-containing protein [Taibaiella helva]
MLYHPDLGATAYTRSRQLKLLIDEGSVRLAGNRKLHIYGTLSCGSGKRMKPGNRVFFRDDKEALAAGYRPCGHCMKVAYEQWKRRKV